MKLVVVVASGTGRTRCMAEACVEGAESEGAEVSLLDAAAAQGDALLDADAFALGCGVHMAGVPTPTRSFLERLAPQWMAGELAEELGTGFVTSGAGARGGGEMALVELLSSLAQHGLLVVSMPSRSPGFSSAGSHWGPIAWTNPRSGEAGPSPGSDHAKEPFFGPADRAGASAGGARSHGG